MSHRRAFVGTSGWAYPHWRRVFYPPGLGARRELAYLASRFTSVEVNGTFYSLVTPAAVDAWREAVPNGFVFAIKGSRFITHMKKLAGVDPALANFFAQGVLRLGAALGPLLWQLPPMLRFDAARARAFLELLPEDVRAAERLARRHDDRVKRRCALKAPDGRDERLRHAFEVRHPSWLADEALRLLERHDVALVAADTAGRHPASLARTASFAYARLHGSRILYGGSYTDEELATWAARVDAWTAERSTAFVYFDNDANAYAPADALRLIARLTATAR